MMDEFEFISRFLAPLAGPEGLGLKDDAALFKPSSGRELVLTKDTMVEGVHFPHGHYGKRTAEKLLRVNLSDLAAKGADPVGYLLSIVWPRGVDQEVFKDFSSGLAAMQKAHGFKLLGGDTSSSRGSMVVTATLIGEVPDGQMVKRRGAKPGDDIWMSGTIGDAYLGLCQVLRKPLDPKPKAAGAKRFENAYFRPEPRLVLRDTLRRYASACVDISDGLIADAGHIAKASAMALNLNVKDVSLSRYAEEWVDGDETRLKTLITAGDDYELIFTSSPENYEALSELSSPTGLLLTKIGAVETGAGVNVIAPNGKTMTFTSKGHKHF